MGHIEDRFSHAELVRELRIEAPFARHSEIIPDAFWTHAVAAFGSSPRAFEDHHACPILRGILERDHLVDLATPLYCAPGGPPSTVIVSRTCDPPAPRAVPEPSPMVLASIAIIAAVIFLRIFGWTLAKSDRTA